MYELLKIIIIALFMFCLSIYTACHKHSANAHMHRHSFKKLVGHFESAKRKKWQKPDLVISKMGDITQKTVADLGAGTGYFSFRLARKGAKVIAIDIDERFLNFMRRKQKKSTKPEDANVIIRRSTATDPALKTHEADIVLVVNVYHHIDNRIKFFKKLKVGIKTGGKLIIVDFKKGDIPVGPPDHVRLSAVTVIEELKKAGFKGLTNDGKSLPYQYIIISAPVGP